MHAHVLVGAVQLTDGQRQGCRRGGLVLMALAALYLLPTIVAAIRHVPNITSIAVINIFAGFTLWGWVSAMALACRHMDRSSPSPAPSYAPGWYPDPWMPARLRYFDGGRWTGRIASPSLETPISAACVQHPSAPAGPRRRV